MDPVAPMALRLQSNLLYGVSRVYSQQCGYTLLDVQAMHDRMRTMLRSVAAGGLEPSAGKARPDQLILPYDPTFLPEINLPGLFIDLTKLTQFLEPTESQQSSFLPQTPDLRQSAISSNSSLRLNLPSDDNILRDIGGFTSEADIGGSVQGGLDLAGLMASNHEDGGVLLQPDFEFDEDGNIVEIGGRYQSEVRTVRLGSEMRENETTNFTFDDQPILADEDIGMAIPNGPSGPTDQSIPPVEEGTPVPEAENADDRNEVTMRQRYRAPKFLPSDGQIALRSFELTQMNKEYIRNMAVAAKQKRNNKVPTQAKKNAAYWVFGVGIGCVGAGVGTSRTVHPLHFFSGEELFEALAPNLAGRKRPLDDDQEYRGRRVRAREEEDDHMGLAGLADDNNLYNEDVELGRRASPALQDDSSLQMPWNITAASIQSSRHETSANIFGGVGSVSDFSSRGIPESAGSLARDAGIGIPRRPRSRLTSASPLSGRGLPYDINQLNGLSIPGQEDDLEGFDLTQYLEYDAMGDSQSVGDFAGPSNRSQPELQNSLTESVMDQEGLNFLDFLAAKINSSKDSGTQGSSADDEITFSALLLPQKTSRAVATHGLMHILALTTKGFLSVRQDAYVDQSTEEHGVRYEYGEISMRLV
ncbi:hypothetical protein BJY01DRAFT_247902 [Aspergillus pseudoustus]|uniref:Rad21/Rec8-like protein N-terminal domain-containing protein n=1 Tax=Aspergillus pseudoustus TaxID=1810923 RepID=A0ABR4K152_9EURO